MHTVRPTTLRSSFSIPAAAAAVLCTGLQLAGIATLAEPYVQAAQSLPRVVQLERVVVTARRLPAEPLLAATTITCPGAVTGC